MERRLYNEDFEHLIKDKADQYKMYPSEKVWKSVYKSLHASRRWYWAGLLLFLGGVGGYVTVSSIDTAPAKKRLASTVSKPTPSSNEAQAAIVVPFVTVPAQTHFGSDYKADTRSEISYVTPLQENNTALKQPGSSPFSIGTSPIQHNTSFAELETPMAETIGNDIALSFPPPTLRDIPTSANLTNDAEPSHPRVNWLQDLAVFELTVPKLRRGSWQLTFSPTMNYRKLVGNKNSLLSADVKNVPLALSIKGDLDHLVNHKPAIGFELGTHLLYAVSKNITLKGGIQFNYSRYEIQAYSGSTERATIALTDFSGVDNDSITSYTSLRNFGGNEVKDLNNQYFQLSAPVGAEFVILGNRRLRFAVAATIQPTYLINRNTYLITTDYKNYTREPSLIRRWNVNTSAEAFVSYSAVGIKWQIGPQFRYQLLSSYTNKYPIKEYLMEYGVKVGVSKTIR